MLSTDDELTRDSRFEFSAEELKRLELRWRSDVDLKLDRLDRRLIVMERLIYVATGATLILAALATIAWQLSLKQSERLDELIVRQATESATNAGRIEAIKLEIQRMQESRK